MEGSILKSKLVICARRVALLFALVGITTHCSDDDASSPTVAVYARPSRLVVVDQTLVVGLAQLSNEFDAATRGHVALIDVETAELTSFALPEAARNCGAVRAVPQSTDLVLVACSGFARPFGDEPQVRASSGMYILRITAGQAEIVRTWEPQDDATRPLAVNNVTPVSATRFVGVDFGTFGVSGDRAYVVDMQTGDATLIFEADEAFSIGAPPDGPASAYDPASGILLIADSSDTDGGLRRYRDDGSVFTFEATLTFSDPLPPARPYRLPDSATGPRFAVVRSDFQSTSIATLDANGAILDEAILSSESQPTGLVAPLSGDVVLANATRNTAGVLNVVDRLGTDVITRFDLETEDVLGQIRVAPGDFSTNPQDMAIVDQARAWVSRFSVNLDPDAPEADLGNDVIEIDPSTFQATGRRVGLESFTTFTSTLTAPNGG